MAARIRKNVSVVKGHAVNRNEFCAIDRFFKNILSIENEFEAI